MRKNHPLAVRLDIFLSGLLTPNTQDISGLLAQTSPSHPLFHQVLCDACGVRARVPLTKRLAACPMDQDSPAHRRFFVGIIRFAALRHNFFVWDFRCFLVVLKGHMENRGLAWINMAHPHPVQTQDTPTVCLVLSFVVVGDSARSFALTALRSAGPWKHHPTKHHPCHVGPLDSRPLQADPGRVVES